MNIAELIDGATTTATGFPFDSSSLASGHARTYQASVTGTGAVSATVIVDVSNDGEGWIELATVTLSGTTSDTDGFASDAPWKYCRARVTAISGTSAAVDVVMGY